MTNVTRKGMSDAGNLHVQFDGGNVHLKKSSGGALLYSLKSCVTVLIAFAGAGVASGSDAVITYSNDSTISETVTATSRISVQDNATVTLNSEGKLSTKVFTREGSNPATIRFNGGRLLFSTSGGADTPILRQGGGGPWTLESVNGQPILIQSYYCDTAEQKLYKNFVTKRPTTPSLIFTGSGDVIFGNSTPGYNPLKFRFQSYGITPGDKEEYGGEEIQWNQAGNLVFNGAKTTVIIDNDNILPAGAQTGGVVVDNDSTVLDFNATQNKINSLDVKQGVATNTSETTAAVLQFGSNNADDNASNLVKGNIGGRFVFEKIGSGSLTIDAGNYDTWKLTEGTLQFKATTATPESKAITLKNLVVDAALSVLVVDGVNVTCGTVSGTALAGMKVVTRNGGTFTGTTYGDSAGWIAYHFGVAEGDTYVKSGTGKTTVVADDALAGGLSVQQGTLALRSPYVGSTDPSEYAAHGFGEIVRVTFKNTYNGGKLALHHMHFYGLNNLGNFAEIDGGASLTSAGDIAWREVASMDELLVGDNNQGQMMLSHSVLTGGDCLLATDLFNTAGNWKYHVRFDATPVLTDASTWVTVTFNLRWWQNDFRLMGVNFFKPSGTTTATVGFPTAWSLEIYDKATGNWTLVDERQELTPPSTAWTAAGFEGQGTETNGTFTYFPLAGTLANAAHGFSSTSSLRVDAGATLDTTYVNENELAVSRLTVDYNGSGTITRFKPATTGEIVLENVPSGKKVSGFEIPITFGEVVSPANFMGWTLHVNGSLRSHKIAYKNGKLTICPTGFMIICR